MRYSPLVLFYAVVFCDFSFSGQCLFQDAATPAMEGISQLHHDLMFILTVIAVFWFCCGICWLYKSNIAEFTSFVLVLFRYCLHDAILVA